MNSEARIANLEKSQNNTCGSGLGIMVGNQFRNWRGYVRDPSLLEKLYKTPKRELPEVPYFIYLAVRLVVLILFGMLVAGMISLFVG